MAGVVSLAVRVSAQIAEFQKAFAQSTKTVEDFKSSFEKSAAQVQATIDGLKKAIEKFGVATVAVGAGLLAVTAGAAAISAAFDVAQRAVEGFVGVFADAFNKTVSLGDQLFKMSQQTGLSVESLSALRFIAGQTGTSLDAISGAVFKLEANLGKGAKNTADAINRLGLSLTDLRKSDPAAAFASIIQKLGELPNASARAAAGVAIFGKSFKDISQLSQENLPELIAKAKELGLVMSTETAVAADRFNDAMGELNGRLEGFRLQLGAKVLPAVIAFVEAFGSVFSNAFAAAVKAIGLAGGSFDTFAVQVGQAIGRTIEVLALLADAVVAWATATVLRVTFVAEAFLALAKAAIPAGQALDVLFSGGQHFEGFNALSRNIDAVREKLETFARGVATTGVAIRTFAQELGKGASKAGEDFAATYKRVQEEIAASSAKMRASLKSVTGEGLGEGAKAATDEFAKSLAQLTAQIELAKANGSTMAQLVDLFGKSAEDAAKKAEAWGISVRDSVKEVATAFRQGKIDEQLSKFRQEVEKTHAATREAIRLRGLEQMENDAKTIAASVKSLVDAQERLNDLRESGIASQLTQIERARKAELDGIKRVGAEESGLYRERLRLTNAYYDHLVDVALGTSDTIVERMRAQGVLTRADLAQTTAAAKRDYEQMKASGEFSAQAIQDAFERMNDALRAEGKKTEIDWSARLKKLFKDLKDIGKDTARGISQALADGIESGNWSQFENNLKDVLANGIANALAAAVDFVIPGLGTILQPLLKALADKFLGFLGLGTRGRDMVREFAESFGGFDALRQRLNALGEEGERLWRRLTQGVGRDNPQQARAAIDAITAALGEQDRAWDNIGDTIDAVNRRVGIFARQFEGITDTAKLAEIAQRAQPEFERLGVIVASVFSELVRHNGDAIGAINALAPSLEILRRGVNEFGLESTAAIDQLLANFDLLNNEAFKGLFEQIQATGQILQGLDLARALNPVTFQALAADIGQSIQEIVNRGGDMSRTLALSQPVLQALFEAQQRYGAITDETTQSILRQAEEQGLVGDHMKSVNDKILQVLIAIADVFGAKIPEGFRATTRAAEEAATSVERSLGRIKVPKITIPIGFDWQNPPPRDFIPLGVPHLAHGGIVNRPTLALVGESGPEAVVPLSHSSMAGATTIILEMDGRQVAEATVPHIPGVVQRYGLA